MNAALTSMLAVMVLFSIAVVFLGWRLEKRKKAAKAEKLKADLRPSGSAPYAGSNRTSNSIRGTSNQSYSDSLVQSSILNDSYSSSCYSSSWGDSGGSYDSGSCGGGDSGGGGD